MIKTIIIEDEKPAARKLERLLSLFTDLAKHDHVIVCDKVALSPINM